MEDLVQRLKAARAKVDVADANFSVREIVRMFREQELNIAPSYQRKFRWPKGVASTFIESIFLGLPIPPIFVATNDDFQWEVVDGLQRISTLVWFMASDQESLAEIGKDDSLSLVGLENLSDLNGKKFAQLPDAVRLYFSRQPLQVVSLTDKSDKKVRFDLFERLNAGSVALTAQEVRTAVYAGKFINFVEELAMLNELSSIVKLQEKNQNNGTLAEQVVKFFAFKNRSDRFKGQVTNFLNEFVAEASKNFDYAHERKIFVESLKFMHRVLDGEYFLKTNHNTTPLVQFEACMVAVGKILESGGLPVIPPDGWIDDKELIAASTAGSNTPKKLQARVNRAIEIFSGN